MADEDPETVANDPSSRRINENDLERALAYKGVSTQCNLCRAKKWGYISRKDGTLKWIYHNEEDFSKTPEGLGVVVRYCRNCGNAQQFVRIAVELTLDIMRAEEPTNG